jgi:predicted lipid-binding transport protein (Tim44 family)
MYVRSVATVSPVPSSDLEKRPVQTPDPHDEPSVEWGWHGTLPKGTMIAGWLVAILMFGLFIGNQVGHIEDFYLGLTGVVMIVLLLLSARRRRRAWRR